jgi:putative peptidoglycan lipid II flippase
MKILAYLKDLVAPVSTNRRIFRAAATVGVISVGVKSIATLKEVAVANYFGRGEVIDAFLVAFLLPGFVVVLVAGSLNAALVPTFVQVRQNEGEEAARQLFSSCMLGSQALSIGLAILMAATANFLVRAIAPSFSAANSQLCTHLFRFLLPIIVCGGVTANCAALLNANKCFWLPALSPILTPLFAVALLLTRARTFGVLCLVFGALLGGFLECVLLGLALSRRGIHLWPLRFADTPYVRQVGRQYIPLLVGSLLVSGVTVVDQSMAAWLSPGSVAALVYGNRVVSVLVALTATSLSAAVIPYFSEMVASRNWAACRHTLQTYTRNLLLLMTPVCVLLIAFSPAVVRLLFQRGAFTAKDTLVVSRVQAMYALQIPFGAAGLLYVRMLTAMKRNDLVMISAGISLVLDVILNLICMKFFGVAGIALSTSLFYAASLCFAFFMARRLLSNNIAAQIRSGSHHPELLPCSLD